jgi:hypothetical protein
MWPIFSYCVPHKKAHLRRSLNLNLRFHWLARYLHAVLLPGPNCRATLVASTWLGFRTGPISAAAPAVRWSTDSSRPPLSRSSSRPSFDVGTADAWGTWTPWERTARLYTRLSAWFSGLRNQPNFWHIWNLRVLKSFIAITTSLNLSQHHQT